MTFQISFSDYGKDRLQRAGLKKKKKDGFSENQNSLVKNLLLSSGWTGLKAFKFPFDLYFQEYES